MKSLRQKGTRKTETVYSVYVETYRDKRAGEHREDIGGGQKDCNEQSPVQSYGGSPMPYAFFVVTGCVRKIVRDFSEAFRAISRGHAL